jgi:hypothetical protein
MIQTYRASRCTVNVILAFQLVFIKIKVKASQHPRQRDSGLESGKIGADTPLSNGKQAKSAELSLGYNFPSHFVGSKPSHSGTSGFLLESTEAHGIRLIRIRRERSSR